MERLVHKKNVRTTEQMLRMTRVEKEKLCPFCAKGLKEIHKLPLLKENKYALLTQNAFPYEGTRHHFLIIPKRHISHLQALTSAEWQAIGSLVTYASKKYKLVGCSLFARSGDMRKTGSSISHMHFQLIEGNSSDRAKNKESLKVKLGYKKG